MSSTVKTLLYGLTDAGQGIEAAMLPLDGFVVEVGDGEPPCVAHELAERIARALPPLTARWARLARGSRLPAGYSGACTPPEADRPTGAAVHVACIDQDGLDPETIPADVDAVWLRPRSSGSSSATRFDFALVQKLSHLHRVILEVPDGAAGVEVAIRLGRPYAVLFADAVWFRPGIVDLDLLEQSLAVVQRLNKRSL
ncbi:MAG: hypothetical protein JSV80_05270 [Acidobacteriota bacterium]|nr:MAG: hypothetical protein JSV80_05270 [Acidobacteriota bacterium]